MILTVLVSGVCAGLRPPTCRWPSASAKPIQLLTSDGFVSSCLWQGAFFSTLLEDVVPPLAHCES